MKAPCQRCSHPSCSAAAKACVARCCSLERAALTLEPVSTVDDSLGNVSRPLACEQAHTVVAAPTLVQASEPHQLLPHSSCLTAPACPDSLLQA